MSIITGDLTLLGTLKPTGIVLPDNTVSNASCAANAAIARSKLAQDALAVYGIPMSAFRTHDAMATNLPGTSSGNDLAYVGGTHSTNSPSLKTADLKSAGATSNYARVELILPAEYDSGNTVTLRLNSYMLTTVADVSATVDVTCFKADRIGGVGSDICATVAQDMNSLTPANKDFTITPTGLVPGDKLDVRIEVAVNDASTGTAVIAAIGAVELLLDIRG